jgi:GAF domain-containing protein
MSTRQPAPAEAIRDFQEAIRRITRALTVRQTAGETLKLIAEEARSLTGAASVAIGLRAGSGRLLDFVAVAGENADTVQGLQIFTDDSLAEAAFRTGQPTLLGGGADPQTRQNPRSHAAAAVAPIKREGAIIGALFALNKTDGAAFTPEDAALLETLVEYVPLTLAHEEAEIALAERKRELEVLYDAALTVSGSLNVQEVLNSVLDAVCQHLPHQAAALFLLNDERTHLFIAADRGLNDDDREIQLAADGPVTARVLETGQPLLIADTDLEPDFDDLTTERRTRSAVIAPIRSRNDILGLILVSSGQATVYNANDLRMLSAVASQAGIAIQNAWLYEDATRRAEEATALYDLSQHVNATLHMDRVFQFVAESVVNLLKVDKFALLLMDRQEERLVTRVSIGVDRESFERIRPRSGEGIAGWVFEWMTPTAVADVAADSRNFSAPIHQEGVVSTICVPMAVGDEMIGVLMAMSSRRRLFTVAEMELLYTIANQAAVAIVNAMLYQDARSKSSAMRAYFHRVARALGSALEAQDMPQLMADLTIEVMRADRCAIYRVDGEVVRLQATSHFRSSTPPDAGIPLGEGLAGWVARRGKPLVIPLLSEEPRSRQHAWLSRERLSSYLGVPLKIGRRTVGVVEIYTQEPRIFNAEEIKLLTQFARRARVADRLVVESA